jgi:O-antigen/teichoic acid export membrane protein
VLAGRQTLGAYRRSGRHRRLDANADQLIRSSAFLIASTGTMSLLGFGFWIVVARMFTPEEVGAATSLISATSLIAYISLFGLNGVIVRFIANTKNPDAQVTHSMIIVGTVALFISAAYVMLVPIYTPALSFVRDNPLYACVFLVAGAAASINLLTDAVFIGVRKPEFNFLVDGIVQGVTKLVLPAVLLGLGAYGIFGAAAGGYIAAVVVSIVCMRRVLGFRVNLSREGTITRAQVSYSFANYISSGLAVVPIMVLPLIALRTLGSAETAYFALTFQIATLLYGVAYAVGEALFAEGSFDESRLGSLLKRSGVLMVALNVPALTAVAVLGPFVLMMFGTDYLEHGRQLLVILAVGALAVALHTWADFVLKLLGLMKSLVISGVLCAVVTIGLAQLWGSRGLEWLGWAWLAGNLASGLFAVMAIVLRERTPLRSDGLITVTSGA